MARRSGLLEPVELLTTAGAHLIVTFERRPKHALAALSALWKGSQLGR